MVRGRVNGGRTGEPVWAVTEGAFTNFGGVNAAKAVERLVSAAGGVCLRYCDVAEVGSESLLPTEGVPPADADKLGTDNIEGEDAGIFKDVTLGDEEFVLKDEGADINLGGAGMSC